MCRCLSVCLSRCQHYYHHQLLPCFQFPLILQLLKEITTTSNLMFGGVLLSFFTFRSQNTYIPFSPAVIYIHLDLFWCELPKSQGLKKLQQRWLFTGITAQWLKMTCGPLLWAVSYRNYFVSSELLPTVSLHLLTDKRLKLVTAPDVNINNVL